LEAQEKRRVWGTADFEMKRARIVAASALVSREVTPEIEALYIKSGSSYAIVRNTPKEVHITMTRKKRTVNQIIALLNRERKFVPILLGKINLEEVFWMNTEKIVILGKEYKSICHACVHKIRCTQEGINTSASFNCGVRMSDLVEISRRSNARTVR
jgi:hypothetical protein